MMKALFASDIITFKDFLILLGLVSIGAGLFLLFGYGIPLVVVGAILLMIGYLGN
jgi:hypothetical protein